MKTMSCQPHEGAPSLARDHRPPVSKRKTVSHGQSTHDPCEKFLCNCIVSLDSRDSECCKLGSAFSTPPPMSSFYATPATKRSSRTMAQESMSFHGACIRAVRLKFRPCANGKSLAKFHNDFGDGMLDTEYY